MTKFPKKADLCKQYNINVEIKTGWCRMAKSIAEKKLSKQEYQNFMSEMGWMSIA